MIIEIPNIKGVDNRLNLVPCMNGGCIFFSTSRCPIVAYNHITESNQLVKITTTQ